MRIERAMRRHSSTPTRPSARGDETKETKEEESWPLDVVALRAVRVRARAWMDGLTDDASIQLIPSFHSFVRSFVRVDFGRLTSRSCARTVPTGTVQVVQQCGKFAFFANEGCHFVNPCVGQAVAGTISTRVQSLDVSVETKTKDNVFVMIVVSVRVSASRSSFVRVASRSFSRAFG